jgi:[heparan sulfate]-glucosamine 3-sulfotransferase 5
MPFAFRNQITLEKSPAVFKNADPKHVYDMNPNIKLIIIIRDPTTRAISQFAHFLTTRNKVEYNPNKYDSISKCFEDLIFNNKTGKVNNHSFITAGMYVKHYK